MLILRGFFGSSTLKLATGTLYILEKYSSFLRFFALHPRMNFIRDEDGVSIKQGADITVAEQDQRVEQTKPRKPVCTCAAHAVVTQRWISDETAIA